MAAVFFYVLTKIINEKNDQKYYEGIETKMKHYGSEKILQFFK
jgi:hypothetical protein